MNLLQHIAQSRHLLRKSELKVADYVLQDPSAVMHSSMADLAHEVGISEPTIVRFSKLMVAFRSTWNCSVGLAQRRSS